MREIEIYFEKGTCIKHLVLELGVGQGVIVSNYILFGLQRKDQFSDQLQNNDTFFRPLKTDIQCFFRTEKHSVNGKNFDYPQDKFPPA